MSQPSIDVFRPLLDAARDLDLDDPALATATLIDRFDPTGPEALALNAKLVELLEAGEIANRGEPPMKWGRAAKPSGETDGYSIDVVHMNGAGPLHRHPLGEIDYCVALDGSPEFDGYAPGWVVLGAGSEHVPTVTGGTMLIVYLLPEGSIEFVK
jgi:hypothetical protein